MQQLVEIRVVDIMTWHGPEIGLFEENEKKKLSVVCVWCGSGIRKCD